MKERGINDTKAHFLAHLFPLDKKLYCYSVFNMLDWIKQFKPVLKIGKSKDGTETGKGYIVSKDAPFIMPMNVPESMLSCFDWLNGTDREVGFWGETVLGWMIATGRAKIPFYTVQKLSTKKAQFTQGDFGIQFVLPEIVLVEVKTEMKDSDNLFVQTHEGGHRVNQKIVNGDVVIKATPAPWLKESE